MREVNGAVVALAMVPALIAPPAETLVAGGWLSPALRVAQVWFTSLFTCFIDMVGYVYFFFSLR